MTVPALVLQEMPGRNPAGLKSLLVEDIAALRSGTRVLVGRERSGSYTWHTRLDRYRQY
jgi:hypothetical protein